MADEAYRAVFLRVHPTGKMVLSLTTEADGNEPGYAQLVADELGVPALDVKVVPADENRFGTGHGFNTAPSPGTPAAITARRARSWPRRKLLAGVDLGTDELRVGRRRVRGRRRGAHDRRHRALRARHRRAPARRRGRPRRPDGVPRLMDYGPDNATLTVHTKRGGAAAKAGHDLTILVERWSATLRRRRARLRGRLRARCASSRATGGITSLGDDEKAGDQRRRSTRRCSRARRSRYRDGELTLNGVTRPIDFTLRRHRRPRGDQADRLQDQALLGAVRDPQGRRRRRGESEDQWLSSTTASRPARTPATTGTRSSTSTGSSRASRAARCSSASPTRRPRPRSRSRWARCR